MGIAILELQQLHSATDSTPISDKRKKALKNDIFSGEVFVNRNELFVPLQCQNEEPRSRSLRIKIASIKSRNCAH